MSQLPPEPKLDPASTVKFYRDAQGINPNCQQVWMALECKEIPYETILVDESPELISDATVPRVEWPTGEVTENSLEILEEMQKRYNEDNGHPLDLYKRVSVSVDNVRCSLMRTPGVFQRKTDMEHYQNVCLAPYLFTPEGTLTNRNQHMVTLEEIDECLEEYDDGPFICGDFVSAADMVWGPWLERLQATLPMVLEGETAQPRSGAYEEIQAWYRAMEQEVPAYSCRVGGDSVSWQRLLTKAVHDQSIPSCPKDLALLPPRGMQTPSTQTQKKAESIWKSYSATRPHVAASPAAECVAVLVRQRAQFQSLLEQSLPSLTPNELDEAYREVLAALLDENTDYDKLSGNARDVAASLDEAVQSPRDMGMLPAATLRALVKAAPAPRIQLL